MIAAIEREHSCVWGVGHASDEALSMAKREMAEKPHFKVGKLELVQLSDDADLDCCGETLWRWVRDNQPVQGGLF